MHLKGLDLNLLVALDALLRERNVSRAADALHVTQSTMSGALSRLRIQLDDAILVQTGRKMVPTSLGIAMAGPLRKILDQVQSLIDASLEFRPSEAKRHFRIIASDYVATVILPKVMLKARIEAPGVSVEVIPILSRTREAISGGDVDLAFLPKEFAFVDHPSEALLTDYYSCLLDGDRKDESLPADEYLSAKHVVCRFGDGMARPFDEHVLDRRGYKRKVDVVVANFNQVPWFVAGTDRIATVPSRLAHIYTRSNALRILPMPVDIGGLTEAMQWHLSRSDDVGLTWLRSLIQRETRTLFLGDILSSV
jgi:DNA-binding transcriptional LysR family regulator